MHSVSINSYNFPLCFTQQFDFPDCWII